MDRLTDYLARERETLRAATRGYPFHVSTFPPNAGASNEADAEITAVLSRLTADSEGVHG